MCKRNIDARARNLCCCGKAIRITYSECASLVLVMQHAVRVHRIVLSSVAYLVYHILPFYKWYDFRGGGVIEHKTCILIFSTNYPETYLALRKIQRDVMVNVQYIDR